MSMPETKERAFAADAPADAPDTGATCFCGADGDYWRLLVRGAVLLMLTLGLYRFWLTTDIRRFLWSNTELAGEPLEYTGTAIELLLGFLMAIALLLPLYAGLFVGTLYEGVLGGLAGLIGFGLFAVLGPFAVYRARRYRLTRTLLRGVRFHQTGSAWRYALFALLWWSMVALTFGLAYPWAQANLERFKMRHTFYGDLPGRFEGSGLWLFLRGMPMWALVAGPLLVSLVAAVRIINWNALAQAIEQERDLTSLALVGYLDSTGLAESTVLILAALGWTVLAAGMIYPAFQALMLRWWTSGLRFGELALRSQLRTKQVYRIWLRFLWYGLLFVLVAGLGAAICLGVAGVLLGPDAPASREALASGLLLIGYVIMMLGFSTIYQVTVRLSVWRSAIDSLSVTGIGVLDRVKAAGTPSSAVGEGLADALSVGGI